VQLQYTEKVLHVCEEHFTENDFTSTLKTRLLTGAFPTIFSELSTLEHPSQQFYEKTPLHLQEITSQDITVPSLFTSRLPET
jgi:hypothetical protein